MKNGIKNIVLANKELEKATSLATQDEINNPLTKPDRRNFLKKSVLGGITLTGLMGLSTEDVIAETTSKVHRNSAPSDLRITDMR